MSDQEDCLSLAKIQAEVARLRSDGCPPAEVIIVDYMDFSRLSSGERMVFRILPTTRKSNTFVDLSQMEGRARRDRGCILCDMEARSVSPYKKKKPPERHEIDWCKEGF
jgi:hypothetical protein